MAVTVASAGAFFRSGSAADRGAGALPSEAARRNATRSARAPPRQTPRQGLSPRSGRSFWFAACARRAQPDGAHDEAGRQRDEHASDAGGREPPPARVQRKRHRKKRAADKPGSVLYHARLHNGSPKWLVEVSLALRAAARASRAQWSP